MLCRAGACAVPFLASEAGASAGPTASDESESYFYTPYPGDAFAAGLSAR